MIGRVDETHDPRTRSWVPAANEAGNEFPVQNLPFGVFQAGGAPPGIGVAIGDRILDLRACGELGLLRGLPTTVERACLGGTLNALMAEPPRLRHTLRHRLSHLLREGGALVTAKPHASAVLLAPRDVEMLMPAEVGDYTDFYASVFHARNVGGLFRPESPLLPNYKWVPIAYHGRSSSLVTSPARVPRPSGQTGGGEGRAPRFGLSQAMDYELEVGAFLGPGNTLGEPVPLSEAEGRIFGLCLVNDWSARDVQRWEYQPLGPFLAKNFMTTLSPWVVTLEALAPFRCPSFERDEGDPRPLPYLTDEEDKALGGIDLSLEVNFSSRSMREASSPPVVLSRSNLKVLYWTFGQMIAHHTSNGCNLRAGDLVASGTVSGGTLDSLGCLLELTKGGKEPLVLPTGERRTFLEDGDEVVLKGRCDREGFVSIGLGECRGVVV